VTAKSYSVRLLAPDQVPRLRALNSLFARSFAEPETYLGSPPDDTYLRRQLANPNVIVLAALDGDSVVGGLVAYELPKLERMRSEIYIYDLAVDEGYRRRGVATSLIAELQSIGAERGAWVIFVQADYGDDPAMALYSKLGSLEEVMHFDVPVGLPVQGRAQK
jgi:aminoglycoside 3-N-acetyltransferase I